MEITWSSEMRNRSRTPQLLVLSEGKLQVFQGQSIPGKVVVTSSHYKKMVSGLDIRTS
jgi:hypothetical protein